MEKKGKQTNWFMKMYNIVIMYIKGIVLSQACNIFLEYSPLSTSLLLDMWEQEALDMKSIYFHD